MACERLPWQDAHRPLSQGKAEGELTALCGIHPACVLLFCFIFMFHLYCLLGLGLK